MYALPLANLKRIEGLLQQVPLQDLALILLRREGRPALLVYNRNVPPDLADKGLQSKQLDNLRPEDCLHAVAPIVGFAALDTLFPIPTHGTWFFPIQDMAAFRNQPDILKENARGLARWLWKRSHAEAPHAMRVAAKVIELTLPFMWMNRAQPAMAIVLERVEDALEHKTESITWFAAKDLAAWQAHDVHNGWVIALEEMVRFHPGRQALEEHFIELRHLLSTPAQHNLLRPALLDLAQVFWEQWQISGNDAQQKTAYSLTAEAQIIGSEAEDLLAVLPHREFRRFHAEGESVRVYLTPCISETTQSVIYSLSDVLGRLEKDSQRLSDDQGKMALTFSIVGQVFERMVSTRLDLKPVLYKAGHEADLARTMHLLAGDLRSYSQFQNKIPVLSDRIANLAQQAAVFFSLSNPWDKQWRTRYFSLIKQVYQNLNEAWLIQEPRTEGAKRSWVRALRLWHTALNCPDLPMTLNQVKEACAEFLQQSQNLTHFEKEREVAKDLLRITEILLGKRLRHDESRAMTHSSPPNVRDYLNQMVSVDAEIRPLSPYFYHFFQRYLELHTTWESFSESKLLTQDDAPRLTSLHAEFEILKRLIHAPAHEQHILHWACNQDIQRIERMRSAFERGPILRLQVLNPQVVISKTERIYTEIENIGGETAQEVTVSLSPSQRFEFVNATIADQPIERLLPQHSHQLSWTIRPQEGPVELVFSVRYRDVKGETFEGNETRLLAAISAHHEHKPPVAGNPFQAGPAVYGKPFFGRSEELKKILNSLLSGITQPILLRGPRRIGKSSIMWHVRYLLREEGAFQDLGFSKEEEIALRQIRPVLTSLQDIPEEQYIARWWEGVFWDICKEMGETASFNAEEVREEFNRALPNRAFKKYVDLLFQRRPQVRLLVMLDEWDQHRHLPGLAANLRAVIQEEPRINWLISSTWMLRGELGRYSSPFYSQCEVVELKAMKQRVAAKLILELSQPKGIEWQGDALVSLVEKTGARPYLVQWLCHEIYNELVARQTGLVTRDIVSHVFNQIIKTPHTSGQFFAFLWESDVQGTDEDEARLRWLGRLILWMLDQNYPEHLAYERLRSRTQQALGEQDVPVNEEWFEKEFDEQLAQLEFIFDAVEKKGDIYAFSIPLLHAWFHHVVETHSNALARICKGVARN